MGSKFVQGALDLIGKLASGVQTAITAVEKVDPAIANVPAVKFAEAAASLAQNDVVDFKASEANYVSGQVALISTISVDGYPGVVVAFRNDSEFAKQLGL